MSKIIRYLFAFISLFSFVFLVERQMYFLGAVILLSQLVLIYAALAIGQRGVFQEGRAYVKAIVFALSFGTFSFLFQGEYIWPKAFDWDVAREFQMAGGGEWLLLMATTAVFGAVISALIVRRAR